MTEKDAERWATITRLHSESGVADADDFWLEGIDELCSAFQPNKCDGCPVKSFTGRADCEGSRHWHLWAYTIDAYLAFKEENEGHELGPILNEIAAKRQGTREDVGNPCENAQRSCDPVKGLQGLGAT